MRFERKLFLAAAVLAAAACNSSSSSMAAGAPPAPAMDMSTTTPRPDPRVGLAAGTTDSATRHIKTRAAEVAWNLHVVSETSPSEKFVGVTNSDLAFTSHYAIQGN
jgi:hypothetical protein